MAKINKNYFRTGTIVCWDEVGTNQSWDSITDAWDSLKDWAQESGLTKHEFAKRLTESGYLGEEFEPTTVFVYGVEFEATKGYDEARAEAEAEATADEE